MSKKWLAVLPLIAFSLMPQLAQADSWSTFRHDQGRSGYTAESLTLPLAVNWKFSTLSVSGNPSSPVVDNNNVIFAAGTMVFVVDATTGAELWDSGSSIEGTIKCSPTIINDNTMYIGSSSGNLYCFVAASPRDWRLRWAFHTDGPVRSTPVVQDGIVYFGSDDNCFYAVRADDGKQVWKKRTTGDISTAPALTDDRVIFTSTDLMTYAIDTTNDKGIIRWKFRTNLPSISTSPVVDEDKAYIAAGNQLFCLSARTGRIRWTYSTQGDITATPVAHDGMVYFGTEDKQIFAVADRGKLLWKAKLDFESSAPLIMAGDKLIVSTKWGQVYAFDVKEAMSKVDFATEARHFKAPIITPVWKYCALPEDSYKPIPDIYSAAAVSSGALYILPDDGTLTCLTADAPDVDPPSVSKQLPVPNTTINGNPPITISAVLRDEGSGLNESSIALYLDNNRSASNEVGAVGGPEALDHKYDPLKGLISFRTPVTQPLHPLSDGRHTITIMASDWKGNLLTTSWDFTVDNKMSQRPVTDNTGFGGMPGGRPGGMPGGGPGAPGGMPGM